MMVVLDTSAAVDLVLHSSEREAESRLLADAKWVLAPTLFVSEVANVFWKYHAFQNMPMEQAESAMELTLELPDSLADVRELYTEAFAMACRTRHPVYDMLYLVLARRNNALLLTRDKGLIKLAAKHDVRVE
ncbi:type II toxin-antitoxin system VapC family toxin [Pontiellaceae bacterium B12227]|nr:type II toxin-antitoxin system VapC family toxin [Pontiellaceae bacterium B12227]